jgi:hypothetical protein
MVATVDGDFPTHLSKNERQSTAVTSATFASGRDFSTWPMNLCM